MAMMDDDAPDLVEVDDQTSDEPSNVILGLEPQMEDLNISKVPLTLVTGRAPSSEQNPCDNM